MSLTQKNGVLGEFSDGPAKALLITITAGGVGLNLTCANHVFFLDSWWNSAMESQAQDRVYRIGQSKPVFIHHMYMRDTIEEWVIKMKEEKKQVDISFHEDSQWTEPNKELLKALLARYIKYD